MSGDTLIQRFAALFTGNPNYFITCNPKRAKDKQNITQHRQYTLNDFTTHLSGKLGVGTSPLLPDHRCHFAVIDIDVRDDEQEVDFKSIAERVTNFSLPLVMCRTRSGGAHLYLFLRTPAPAKLIRNLISDWAQKMKIPGTDCLIPSADYQLLEDDGTQHVSRSVNLPYFGGDHTNRYCIMPDGVTHLTFEQFILRAETSAINPSLFITMPDDEYGQAPPCVQKLIHDGVPTGMRNEALTQIAIYLKRVDAKDVLPRLVAINSSVLDSPLPLDELKKVAKSTTRRDYNYRCKTEPCKSLCDSKTCLTREFGIKPNEANDNDAAGALAELPRIDDIARVQDTEAGGIYRIRINGHSFTAPAKRLTNVRDAQLLFAERVGIILPAKLSFSVWYDYIMTHVTNARIDIQAIEDTDHGALQSVINDWCAGRLRKQEGMDLMQHRERLNTSPILEDNEILFRMMTFERYCRDKRINIPANSTLIAALLRKIGCRTQRLRTASGVVSAWVMPYQTDDHDQHYDEIEKPDPNTDY